eukprot:gene5037-7734_t
MAKDPPGVGGGEATARIARLVQCMQEKLAAMATEKEQLRKQVDELSEREATTAGEADRKETPTPTAAGAAKPAPRAPHPQDAPSVVLLRILYDRIAQLGGGLATKHAFVRAVKTDPDIRSLFYAENVNETEFHRLFEEAGPELASASTSNCGSLSADQQPAVGDPAGDNPAVVDADNIISWPEFVTTVLGPEAGDSALFDADGEEEEECRVSGARGLFGLNGKTGSESGCAKADGCGEARFAPSRRFSWEGSSPAPDAQQGWATQARAPPPPRSANRCPGSSCRSRSPDSTMSLQCQGDPSPPPPRYPNLSPVSLLSIDLPPFSSRDPSPPTVRNESRRPSARAPEEDAQRFEE